MINTSPLVSIIMPAYNAEQYIMDSVNSVQKQTYENWELIIVNNNSNDSTSELLSLIDDKRIIVLFEKKQGVGYARNKAISHIKGDYFCFLDSDDTMPPNSLKSRLQEFEHDKEISFVDGSVQYVDEGLSLLNKKYVPNYIGDPFPRLLRLDSRCLFGNTWMVKRDKRVKYAFNTKMTHAEDLYFYLSISSGLKYSFTKEVVLNYRQSSMSAMKNIFGLEKGYIILIKNIRNELKRPFVDVFILKIIVIKIMFLSHLFDGRDIKNAVLSPFKILFA